MHRENVLGEIDPDVENGHDFPIKSELMRVRTSHRGTSMPYSASLRAPRDEEVPFIRYGPFAVYQIIFR